MFFCLYKQSFQSINSKISIINVGTTCSSLDVVRQSSSPRNNYNTVVELLLSTFRKESVLVRVYMDTFICGK